MGPLALIGDDAAIWGSVLNPKSYCPDLVALRGRHNEDSFSKWVTEKVLLKLFLCGCAHWKKISRRYGAVGYHDSTLLRVTFWITSILASLLPIASIAILYFVKSMAARLGIIAAFNLILSLCLTAFTTAKRTDVFAVAAAYVSTGEREASFYATPNTIIDSPQSKLSLSARMATIRLIAAAVKGFACRADNIGKGNRRDLRIA